MRTSHLLIALSLSAPAFCWGPDVLVRPNVVPGGDISIVRGPGGVLWASVPDNDPADSAVVSFMTSVDDGATWTLSPIHAPGQGVVPRSRMVGNATDLYCVYLHLDSVRILDLNSGVIQTYQDYVVSEFDCVLRPDGWLYLFVQVRALNDIRRAGTVDGGATWTGNAALVTSQGNRPRVTMSAGDTLILNYYGPPLVDVTKSVVRAGRYRETAPGTLSTTANAFQDVITDTQVDKWGFRSVIHAGRVWLAWSEGPFNTREVKCRVSMDNGTTYGPAFDVFPNSGSDELLSDLQAISGPTASGVGMAVVRFQTPTQDDPMLDQVHYTSATASLPTAFAPEVGFSEHAPTFVYGEVYPQLVQDATGSAGVCWVGFHGGGTALWYDAGAVSTGIASTPVRQLRIWPVPATDRLHIAWPEGGGLRDLDVVDATGRRWSVTNTSADGILVLDISGLANGTYCMRGTSDEGPMSARFIVSR